MADFWAKNEPLFRRLYQEERKSLSEVKEIVEGQPYNFPVHPLSVYETRLRDSLRLRKKLRKEDWGIIHFYAIAHGFGPSGYDVFLNGTQIPPTKVWKEIRRNGYHLHRRPTSNITLPQNVQVQARAGTRTARPVQASNTRHSRNYGRDHLTPARGLQSPNRPLQSWDAFRAALLDADACHQPAEVSVQGYVENRVLTSIKRIDKILEILPCNQFRIGHLESMAKREVTYECPDEDGFPFLYMPDDGFLPIPPGMLLARVADTVYPGIPDVYAQSKLLSSTSGDKLILHRQLAGLVFRITDCVYWRLGDPEFIAFGSMLRRLRLDAVLEIDPERQLSLRAVWDQFLPEFVRGIERILAKFQKSTWNPDAQSALDAIMAIVQTVLSARPGWIQGQEDKVLGLCAGLGSREMVLRCLELGARVSFEKISESPFILAARAGAFDVLGALIDNIDDINAAQKTRDGIEPVNILTHFLVDYLGIQKPLRPMRRGYFLRSLSMLLEAGVDVEAPFHHWSDDFPRFPQDLEDDWQMSCLDLEFYMNLEAFSMMRKYSSRGPEVLTRHGICEAATAGQAALDAYLAALTSYDASQKQRRVQLVMLELFLVRGGPRGANLNGARAKNLRALLEYGYDLRTDGFKYGDSLDIASSLVQVWIDSVKEYGLHHDLEYIGERLFEHKQLECSAEVLSAAVEDEGTELLNLLKQHCTFSPEGLQEHGADALYEAADAENYAAVSCLLEIGVDINAVAYDGQTTIGRCFEESVSAAMCRHLLHLGAKLKYYTTDKTCGNLVSRLLFDELLEKEINFGFEKWDILKEHPTELDLITTREWKRLLCRHFHYYCYQGSLWETSPHLSRLRDELLQRTAEPGGGSPSLVAVVAARSYTMAQNLLAAGVDVNETVLGFSALQVAIEGRNLPLARQMIELGADVNMVGGHHWHMLWDALGTACELRIQDPGERQEVLGLIELLRSCGANLAPSHVPEAHRPWYHSPLLLSARSGEIEVAALLLKWQIDPNLVTVFTSRHSEHDWGHYPYTALDRAVVRGRLDMTQLLLKAGGVSANPGGTGFDGALDLAARKGHLAIVELIHGHIQRLKLLFQTCPDSERCHHEMLEEVRRQAEDLTQRSEDNKELLERWYQDWKPFN